MKRQIYHIMGYKASSIKGLEHILSSK